jgi:hypothetical protein
MIGQVLPRLTLFRSRRRFAPGGCGGQGRGAGHEAGGGPTIAGTSGRNDAEKARAAPADVPSKVRVSDENCYQQLPGSHWRALFPL